jgi:hypothetical protein
MLKKYFLLVFIMTFTAGFLPAQSKNETDHPGLNFINVKESPVTALSGNLNLDNKISFDAVQNEINARPLNKMAGDYKDKKSPWLGALFSVVIPGGGEFYAGSYWKAGIFVAVEAAVITTAIVYNNKGDNQTNFFQDYANTHWSAVKYADWLVAYAASNGITCTIDDDRVRQGDYSQIHQCEDQLSNLSHNLAQYGEQQYYEMIGKYDQFAAGWDDFNNNQLSTTPISEHFHYYSGLRGKANDYYSVASTAVIGIYLNHFLSAVDAYWSTTIYNTEVVVNMSVENQRYADNIELVPTLNLKWSF